MTRLYGRSFSNERVNEYVPDVRFERTSIVGALGTSGMIAPLSYKGTMNGELFTEYVRQALVFEMKKGDTLVLDNYSVHKVKGALQPLIDKGVNIVFLPPYSPDFSPIELAWSKMKAILRKLKARTFEKLEKALKIALDLILATDCINWFKHCGYSTTKS